MGKKTREVRLKKLLDGNKATVRDYVVNQAIKRNITLLVIFDGKTMTLTPKKLQDKSFQMVKRSFASKFVGSGPYKLIDFQFIEDGTDDKQMKMFE